MTDAEALDVLKHLFVSSDPIDADGALLHALQAIEDRATLCDAIATGFWDLPDKAADAARRHMRGEP